MLASKMVTTVRQRVTRELLGYRGRKIDPTWANRRLLRGCERLSQTALARMWTAASITTRLGDPLGVDREGGTPRALRHRRSRRAPRGHRATVVGVLPLVRRRRIPELTTLAETIETWWTAIEFS